LVSSTLYFVIHELEVRLKWSNFWL
jgi:hypothetical protein